MNPQSWITLTPENVKDIHLQGIRRNTLTSVRVLQLELAASLTKSFELAISFRQLWSVAGPWVGGSILVSDRGNPPHLEMVRGLSPGGYGSKPMVPFWGRCTTHFSLF